ncbi:MAG: NACHT domain-containing protein, partial [Nitrospira sp.]|nr:NACHT domain-containing protein [Nitrospira sp.]
GGLGSFLRQTQLVDREGGYLPSFEPAFPIYLKRSTLFDPHVEDVQEGYIPDKILACRQGIRFSDGTILQPNTSEFFEKYYRPVRVQELNANLQIKDSKALPISLLEAVQKSQRPILLVGEGGVGKSTELLRLFMDCTEGKLTDENGTPFVPIFLPLSDLIQRDEKAVRNVYELIQYRLETAHLDKNRVFVDMETLKEELRYTRNLLLLMDGLNEALTQPVQQHRVLETVLEVCYRPPHHDMKVVISTRLQGIDADTAADRFIGFTPYRLQSLDPTEAEAYLNQMADLAGKDRQMVQDLLAKMGRNKAQLLSNPLMIYLTSAILGVDIQEELAREGYPPDTELNRSLIYKFASNRWMKQRVKGKRDEWDVREDWVVWFKKEARGDISEDPQVVYGAQRRILRVLAEG